MPRPQTTALSTQHPETSVPTYRFLTAKEVGILLSLSPKRVYELAQRREIPYVRVGQRQLRFIEEDILTWARKGGTSSQDVPHTFSNVGATSKGVAR